MYVRIAASIFVAAVIALWSITLWMIHEPLELPAQRPVNASALTSQTERAPSTSTVASPRTAVPSQANASAPAPASTPSVSRPVAVGGQPTVRSYPPGAAIAMDPWAEGGPAPVIVTPAPQRPITVSDEDRKSLQLQ